MRTFIRRLGNKSQHINKFRHFLPIEYNVYIEPFVGSGALLLNLKPERWIINDLNKDLMNVWKLVKNNPEKIVKSFKKFQKTIEGKSKKELLIICKEIVNGFNNEEPDTCMFMLMTMMSYIGSIIVNNVYKIEGLSPKIVINKIFSFFKDTYYANLLQVSEFLKSAEGTIYNTDYKKVLQKAKEGDFVFLDPPYVEKNGNYQFNYNKNEKLDIVFVKELLEECHKLDSKGVKWLMTQADTQSIRQLFKSYNIEEMKVYRTKKKLYATELIIRNYTL